MNEARRPLWLSENGPPHFPDPSAYDAEGLIAGGGDLSRERLLAAYRKGIFPWFDERPILWWCPDPRSIITRESLHISRSMRHTLRKTSFTLTQGTAMSAVMGGCSDRKEGTWITQEMHDAYLDLHHHGFALSYEVWQQDELVGGLYGVLIGGVFAAESKFHRKTDASKIALIGAVVDLFDRGVGLFDVQFLTTHLGTLGVHEVSRTDYLGRLRKHLPTKLRAPSPDKDLLPRISKLLNSV